MSEITNELIYEVLKSLQAGQADIKATQAYHTRPLLRLREEFNGLRGGDLRRETLQAKIDTRLERIEIRFNLVDA